MIYHKIREIQDKVCEGCSQNYYGECRAYEMPHSQEESEQRKSGMPNCEQSKRLEGLILPDESS